MRTCRRNRCDEIVELIDRWLAEFAASAPPTTSEADEREQHAPVAA